MKVKILTRNPDDYLRETKRDIQKVPRNYDPNLHPFQASREYVRALNAVKLERVFAKPFIGNLDGHREGIFCMAKHPKSLSTVASGSYDGEIRLWNLAKKKSIYAVNGHDKFVRGLCFNQDGSKLLSVGDDSTVKAWNTDDEFETPNQTFISQSVLYDISHKWLDDRIFATCGDVVQLWDITRSQPTSILQWGVDSLHHIAFNQIDTHVLASCASDRSIIIYDAREVRPMRKVVMKLKSNQLAWNPMEAYIFTVANEDYNCYSYDTRNLKRPIHVHMDHVSAVTCIDYAPTGQEFVTGSYDKSVRIFESNNGHSREVYHTKRMQHLTSVAWSLDNKYVLSASDEMNIRIWKANASEKLGTLRPREQTAMAYNATLKEKYAAHPQVKRIAKHRQIPKHIYHERQQQLESRKKLKRKEENIRRHSKKNSVPIVLEKYKNVIAEVV
ncbi:DDB1- and CUL4-associated factor 13 [Daktulosphaira vitifoliae]|uniref:DDB1- and CUL4-associated factor 13 n=1 Tax=Daktulosphaira vitifoliae TaxID=58002 RepID=UPI0021A9D5A2|nr:DDB1- and CUL4-associated factor 13 [Daktulosphaira vitifoliae]